MPYRCEEIKSLRQREHIIKNNKVVCIDLYADWCGPCKNIAPMYNKLAEKYDEQFKCLLVKENVENEFTSLSGDYNPSKGIPAFIFYLNGEILMDDNDNVIDVVGFDKRKIERIIQDLIK